MLTVYQGGLIEMFYQFRYQAICIYEIMVSSPNGTLHMWWNFTCNNNRYTAIFRNVSRVNIRDWSYPLQICDLEVVDNTKVGWDASSNFFVRDYEEQKLSFYCEKIDITREN